MKVALVYDRVNKIGGAERVLTALHQIFPDAPLYTAVYHPDSAPWSKDFQVIPSFLNRLPGASTRHELLPLLTPYAFESFDFSAFDVVISVTSADAKAVITLPHQLHLCYLLTPTRYLWSHRAAYAGPGLTGKIRRFLINRLRTWDLVAASRPDCMVAISNFVDKRCQKYYHRPADAVIYPPVEVETFASHPTECQKPPQPYFLVVSRLVPYKRIDLAIKACNQLQLNLVVVGTGSEMVRLKQMAGPTITFTGHVSDHELNCLYHHATALIFPQEEEFGITAIEAQAAGLPVIAYAGGAAAEIVIPGITGILFPEQTTASLVSRLATWNRHTWYDKTIKKHAFRFSRKAFQKTFMTIVEDSWQKIHNHA